MNYSVNSIKIKSNWFDDKGKILKLGVDGYNLYLNLFRFRLHNQDEEYTFITSLSLLRKELSKSYTTDKIVELLKELKKLKVIEIDNLSRWDQLIVNDKLDDNRVLIIRAIDRPNTYRKDEKDYPLTNDDNYIVIDLTLMNHYQSLELDEKYYLFYAICRKYQKEGMDFNMSIEKMEERTGIDKNTINRMIWKLHEHYLLLSWKEKRNSSRFNWHHIICERFKDIEDFIVKNKDSIDKEINKRKKKNSEKSVPKQESTVIQPQVKTDPRENFPHGVKGETRDNELAFGHKGSSTANSIYDGEDYSWLDEMETDNNNWGKKDPFTNNAIELIKDMNTQYDKKLDKKKYEMINGITVEFRVNPFTDEKEYLFEGDWLSRIDVEVGILML